jgi:uncharacterized protein YndB with AHSA1/START domain
MKLVDTTPRPQTEALSFELELPHPPEKIWRALTDPELLKEWLLPAFDLKLEPGAEFRFKTQPMPGWDGSVNCRIIDVEPHRMLSYAWVVGDREIETVVRFTLTPTSSGTRLSLTHSGFKPHQKGAWGGTRYGWRLMLGEKLVALLARTA